MLVTGMVAASRIPDGDDHDDGQRGGDGELEESRARVFRVRQARRHVDAMMAAEQILELDDDERGEEEVDTREHGGPLGEAQTRLELARRRRSPRFPAADRAAPQDRDQARTDDRQRDVRQDRRHVPRRQHRRQEPAEHPISRRKQRREESEDGDDDRRETDRRAQARALARCREGRRRVARHLERSGHDRQPAPEQPRDRYGRYRSTILRRGEAEQPRGSDDVERRDLRACEERREDGDDDRAGEQRVGRRRTDGYPPQRDPEPQREQRDRQARPLAVEREIESEPEARDRDERSSRRFRSIEGLQDVARRRRRGKWTLGHAADATAGRRGGLCPFGHCPTDPARSAAEADRPTDPALEGPGREAPGPRP